MKKLLLIVVCMLIFVSTAFGADIVQIATTRDASDKWTGWVVQSVTWDATVVTSIGDHNPISTKALQTWYFPVDNGFLKATFSRIILGSYGLRWSRDGELWSDAETCVIEKPGKPIGK